MAANQTADMKAETRKGHWEEIEHLACRIIKTLKPEASFDYPGTGNVLFKNLFLC